MLIVQRLAGILLEMQPLDAHPYGAMWHIDGNFALSHHWRLVLADLIALRQVRVEIIFAVEHRTQVDLRIKPEAGAHRLSNALLVDHWQHARHRGVNERYVRIRFTSERSGGAGKQLRFELTWAWTSSPMTTSQSP